MHGNSPHAGPAEAEPSIESRRALRRELVDVATSTRALLSDEFVVGAEISGNTDGLQATVAVQPPAGSVVSAGFDPDEDDATAETLAQELAAGAVFEAKRAAREGPRAAR
ncbi:DUF5811 family protein [Natronomonas marina]|jgi:hypothetical protein|uniref:DUF5811 family protein n=1 Tax=Natronomonas marina TaxID=2961939 RepID=UPI0020C94C08|nr:DUF5811 family protein [Natronomonas marina]